ncbi:MAG: 16S rRNA processing protein RimM [Bacteroidetes bacterium]|nr:16S rRNA processing protein RimM [Bacteroidota bacterium]
MQQIGKITGAHGVHGEISFIHQLQTKTRFNQWDCLMVELNPGSFIPFFIESIKSIADDECICKLEEIHSREEAKVLGGKNIYASPNYNIQLKVENNLSKYKGYIIYSNEQKIGEVIDTVEGNMNDMFLVDYQGKEILLPAQKELMLTINTNNKTIDMHIPEGLLDL